AEPSGCVQDPGHESLEPLALSMTDAIHHVMIVAEQDQERLVDDRRVAKLMMGRSGTQRGDGRIDGRGIAEARILRPGAEAAGDTAERPRARTGRVRPRYRAPPGFLGPE